MNYCVEKQEEKLIPHIQDMVVDELHSREKILKLEMQMGVFPSKTHLSNDLIEKINQNCS